MVFSAFVYVPSNEAIASWLQRGVYVCDDRVYLRFTIEILFETNIKIIQISCIFDIFDST